MTKDDIQKLYEKYGSWIFNRARSLLKNEQAAHEAMQDVFLKVLEAKADFRGDSSPWTWLYRITTNHCLNMIRSQKSWRKAMEGVGREQLVLEQTHESGAEVLVNKDWFVKIMEGEDETTQRIIFCYYFDEMTQEEIVDALGISRKTVYKRLKKFMDKARDKLCPET